MKLLCITILFLGITFRISKRIEEYKFAKWNEKRLKNRQKLMSLKVNWVDELLEEIFLNNKIKQ